MSGPTYLDCNATTPLETEVSAVVQRYLTAEYGNAASRTHEFGASAKRAVESARQSIARVLGAKPDEVVFTSGATESNNLALLGLAEFGLRSGRRHIVTTQIEHKAVLEPIAVLEKRGFAVTRVAPEPGGWISASAIAGAVRSDTLLVSVMHANNETGVIQPVEEIASALADHSAFFHVDAAQSFGKIPLSFAASRVDLVSISAHKIYGPKGVGALALRRRGYEKLPLEPLMFGGGHERGLRPGTLPVALIAGLGSAADLALRDQQRRHEACVAFKNKLLAAIRPLQPHFNGDPSRTMAHVLNVSFDGLDSEAVIVALKDLLAISNGSACTSHSYEPRHVLRAMGLPRERIDGAIRLSWCHMTESVEWTEITRRLEGLRS